MSAPKNRADGLLETWRTATARPTPAFVAPLRRRRLPIRVALVALAIVLIMSAIVGALAVGGFFQRSVDRDPPTQLAASAVQAIANAPGVRYSLTIAVHFGNGDGPSILDTSGVIDFHQHRFSGTADGGGGAPMLLFGGPTSGAVIVAGEMFVQVEGQPWERVPEMSPQLANLTDAAALSNALRLVLDASEMDRAVRFAPCGTETCRVIALSAPVQTLFDAEVLLLGTAVQPPPPDLGPTEVELLIDPSSGFPVRMDTSITAGPTTTIVSLQLARLDPVPPISAPLP